LLSHNPMEPFRVVFVVRRATTATEGGETKYTQSNRHKIRFI
jgi:hypothetical protein